MHKADDSHQFGVYGGFPQIVGEFVKGSGNEDVGVVDKDIEPPNLSLIAPAILSALPGSVRSAGMASASTP